MRILRFESVGGASGDMILASLLGLGVDAGTLKARLASLNIGKFDLVPKSFADRGLHGLQVTVDLPQGELHPHRNLEDIRGLIQAAGLTDKTRMLSIEVFEQLAEAEAHVHNTSPNEVHFHEVGALDSIIDIVGSCAALEMLNVDAVSVGPLPLGCGTIQMEHGVLPNPPPATLELLKGHPVIQTDELFELVTPTGAALLMTWKSSEPDSAAPCLVHAQSHGFGHRTLSGRPNLLRATLLESSMPADKNDDCLVLECNIDDMTPELVGALFQKLLDQGALDVFTAPVQMKKQRTGILLTVLCRADRRAELVDLIFHESTTFGLREYTVRRTMLERRHIEVETPYGKVRIKIGTWKGRDVTLSPEYDDCVLCAKAANVPVRTVYEEARALVR